jgi:hypothetical protein
MKNILKIILKVIKKTQSLRRNSLYFIQLTAYDDLLIFKIDFMLKFCVFLLLG